MNEAQFKFYQAMLRKYGCETTKVQQFKEK